MRYLGVYPEEVYFRTLKKDKSLDLNEEQLFSLIAFKNLYPEVFSDLQKETGIVKKAFSDINTFKNEKYSKIEQEIESTEELIEQYNQEVLKNIKELKAAMLVHLADYEFLPTDVGQYSRNQILQEDFDLNEFKDIETSVNIGEPYTSSYHNNRHIPNQEFKDLVLPFINRYNVIKQNNCNDNESIESKIIKLQKDKSDLAKLSIKEVLERYWDDKPLSKEVRKNELLVFLLHRGYVNESYYLYINYFKGVYLTATDQKFILNVKANGEPNPDLRIDHVENVIETLNDYDFDSRAVLNYLILERLLVSGEKYKDKLYRVIKILSTGKDENWSFIDGFIDFSDFEEDFIKLLAENWPDLWKYIYNYRRITYERRAFYLDLIVNIRNDGLLKKQNSEGFITAFVLEHEDILQRIRKDNIVLYLLEPLNIHLRNIRTEGIDSEILEQIFEYHFFEINETMLEIYVSNFIPEYKDLYQNKKYSILKEYAHKNVFSYIMDNLPDFIRNVVLKSDIQNDSIECIIELLNSLIQYPDLCYELIKIENFILYSFESFFMDLIKTDRESIKGLWNRVLNCNKVKASWGNINTYYKTFGLTDSLLNFIDKNFKVLSEEDNYNILSNDFKQDYVEKEKDLEVLSVLLPKIKSETFYLGLDSLSDDKLEVIIKSNFIEFNCDYYEKIEDKSYKFAELYIRCNQKKYQEDIDNVRLSEEAFGIAICDMEISSSLRSDILKRYQTYFTTSLAESILDTDIVIDNETFYLVWNNLVKKEDRKKLFYGNLQVLNNSDFNMMLENLEILPTDFINSNKLKYCIANNNENVFLAKRLKEIGYITSCFATRDKIEIRLRKKQ